MDVSGSMGEGPTRKPGPTKLDLAKRRPEALDEFKPEDEVGLRIFSTDIDGNGADRLRDIVPIGQMAANRPELEAGSTRLVPHEGTPLYTAAGESYTRMSDEYDRPRINAIVLLTDGRNEDPRNEDLAGLLRTSEATRGQAVAGPCGSSRSPTAATPTRRRCSASPRRRTAPPTSAIDPATVVTVFNARHEQLLMPGTEMSSSNDDEGDLVRGPRPLWQCRVTALLWQIVWWYGFVCLVLTAMLVVALIAVRVEPDRVMRRAVTCDVTVSTAPDCAAAARRAAARACRARRFGLSWKRQVELETLRFSSDGRFVPAHTSTTTYHCEDF